LENLKLLSKNLKEVGEAINNELTILWNPVKGLFIKEYEED